MTSLTVNLCLHQLDIESSSKTTIRLISKWLDNGVNTGKKCYILSDNVIMINNYYMI